ncbi:MAG: MFS transporter, partial [Armatimonadota bacterium]
MAIANGIIFYAGRRLADITTVVPLLLFRLSGLRWLVGAGHSIIFIARAIPQVVASRWVDTAERKRPIFIWCALIRFLTIMAMGVSVLYASRVGYTVALVLLLSFFALRTLAQGVSSLAWSDIVARSVPTTKRGSLWKWRMVGGLFLVLLFSAPAVRYMLGDDAPYEFPANYAVLILVSGIITGIGWFVFAMVREPEGKPAKHTLTMKQHLARGMRFVTEDANYRRLMRVRICLSAAGAIVPFFIAFAVDVWGFRDAIAATFITVQILSQMGGSFLSGWISDRLGNRKLLVVSGITLFFTSVFAAVGTYVTPPGGVMVLGHLITWRLLVMMACFVGSGVFMSQLFPAYTNYLIDIAPRRKLPSYIGFGSGFTVPIAAAPIVFGW